MKKSTKPGWIEQFDEGYRQFWKKRGIELPSGPDMGKLFANPNKLKRKVDNRDDKMSDCANETNPKRKAGR